MARVKSTGRARSSGARTKRGATTTGRRLTRSRSRTRAAASATAKAPVATRCPICLEAFPNAGEAAQAKKRALRSAGIYESGECGHEFCQDCIATYATTAIDDGKTNGGACHCCTERASLIDCLPP